MLAVLTLACTSDRLPGSADRAAVVAHVDSGGRGDTAPDSDGHEDTSADSGHDSAEDSGHLERLEQTPGSLHLPSLVGKSIIILHVDTLRADHLAAYGYFRETTPRLSAREWLVVDGEIAASSWTVPSTASFFTGLDVRHHNVRYLTLAEPNQALSATTFATRLADAGYATGLFTGNLMVSEQTHLSPGFQTETQLQKMSTGAELNSANLTAATLGWIDGLQDGQLFMAHVQAMDPHAPYVPPAAYAGTWATDVQFQTEGASLTDQPKEIQALLAAAGTDEERAAVRAQVNGVYDETLLGLDEGTDQLLAGLEDRGLLDDVAVFLTADHGEDLDDAGDSAIGHGGNLREPTIHLPLMILDAGLAPGKTTCRMRNYDLWPTIFVAMGNDMPDGLDGVDLAAGCPTTATSSLWDDSGRLMLVATDGARSKLHAHCIPDSARNGTNFGADYRFDESAAVSTLLDADALEEALSNDIAAIEADLPGARCHVE